MLNLIFSLIMLLLSFDIKITLPPRAITSCIFEIVFSKYLSLGAKITTGKPSSIKAKGPCFISPAGYPFSMQIR